MKKLTPHPLFDALQVEHRIKNDAELCRQLGVQPPSLSKMRNGILPIPDTLRVAIMRKFRWPLRKLDELAPPAAIEEAAEAAH